MMPRRVIPIVLIALAGVAGYALCRPSPPRYTAGRLLRDHPAYSAPWRFFFLNAGRRRQALSDFRAAVEAQKPGIITGAIQTVATGSDRARRQAEMVLSQAGKLTADQLQPLRKSSDPAIWAYAALRENLAIPSETSGIRPAPSRSVLDAALRDVADRMRDRLSLPADATVSLKQDLCIAEDITGDGQAELILAGEIHHDSSLFNSPAVVAILGNRDNRAPRRLIQLFEFTHPERLQHLSVMDLDADGILEVLARSFSIGANWHTSRLYVFSKRTLDTPVVVQSRDPAGRLRLLRKTPDGPVYLAAASYACPIGWANTVERRAGQPGLHWSLQQWTGQRFEQVGQAVTPFPCTGL